VWGGGSVEFIRLALVGLVLELVLATIISSWVSLHFYSAIYPLSHPHPCILPIT